VEQAYGESKFDAFAEGFTAHTYADPARYFGRRLELFLRLGPSLPAGARVLELGCGDGTFAELLVERGFDYAGVDLSRGMVEATRKRLGDRGAVVQGDLNTFVPAEPVDAVVSFNASYYATDRVAFFRRVRELTGTKLVLDFIPRDHPNTPAELRAAGWEQLALRPFFVPQGFRLPRPAQLALETFERVPPIARMLLRRRFLCVCAVWNEESGP
jgi:cyclopropane fatty-acyl-phospholipid synthase-like methyltransferase